MTVYLINIFSIPVYALFLHLLSLDNRKKNIILCFLVAVQLFLTGALRAVTVGGDLEGYVPTYIRLGNSTWDEVFIGRLEPGYLLLNKILTFFTTDERLLLVVTSGIVVVGFCVFICKNSRIPWLSLYLFIALGFYTTSLSMLRQSLAIALILGSVRYVEQRKFFNFLIVVLAAVLFHYTAVVFLILYPISRFKVTWGYFICMLTGAFLISWVLGKIFLFTIIEKFYSSYEDQITGGTGYNMLLLLILVTVAGLFLWRKREDSQQRNVIAQMMILACCFQFMALHFGLFARVVLYFSVSQLIFIPNAISCISVKDLKFLTGLIVSGLAIFYFVVFILGGDSCGILPYRFMWE